MRHLVGAFAVMLLLGACVGLGSGGSVEYRSCLGWCESVDVEQKEGAQGPLQGLPNQGNEPNHGSDKDPNENALEEPAKAA